MIKFLFSAIKSFTPAFGSWVIFARIMSEFVEETQFISKYIEDYDPNSHNSFLSGFVEDFDPGNQNSSLSILF